MTKLEERLLAAAQARRTPVAPIPAPERTETRYVRPEKFESRMQRWTCYVERDVLVRLHAFAKRTGVRRSRVVSEALSDWLDNHRDD